MGPSWSLKGTKKKKEKKEKEEVKEEEDRGTEKNKIEAKHCEEN